MRPLNEADLPRAGALSAQAGWNQNQADWRIFLRDGALRGLDDGDAACLAASAAVLPFGADLGFGGVRLGNLFISYNQMILVGVAGVLMLSLELFVTRTQYGRAMRAISIDKDMSRLLGINVNSIIAVTFMIGAALAAAAGTMAGAFYGSLWYFMGFLIGLKAFTAAVIGGIGSIPGAMLGGLILGLLESFATQIDLRGLGIPLKVGSEWKDVFSFSVLILILVFKPTGLLGKS